jgi:hypothetical protein
VPYLGRYPTRAFSPATPTCCACWKRKLTGSLTDNIWSKNGGDDEDILTSIYRQCSREVRLPLFRKGVYAFAAVYGSRLQDDRTRLGFKLRFE